jgi:hypothetical protein
MASEQELPNTENLSVTLASIAFAIASTSMSAYVVDESIPEEYAARFAAIFNSTYKSIKQ